MDDFEKELKEDFLQEATDLIDEFEQVFLDLEIDSSPEILDKVFRFAHNLKGTSRAVGFGDVAEFTHEVENLILKLKEGEMLASPEIVSLLLKCNDHIAHMIVTLKENLEASFDSSEYIDAVRSAMSGEPKVEASQQLQAGADLNIEENEKLQEQKEDGQGQIEAPVEESFSEEDVDILEALEVAEQETLQAEAEVQDAPVAWEKPKKKAPVKKKVGEDEYIRVALQKIERLNNYVGELALLQTVLEQRRFVAIRDGLANKSIGQLGKISKEIQDIAMSMRMVPIKSTLQKMNRIVRDTSSTLNKRVKLHLEGEETEIDKTVLELVVDPLVHIVRNAVDHGVETPEEREGSGKPPEGSIWIRAYHQGNSLVIEVEDNGKGIDSEVVLKKALEKGIVTETSGITEQEAVNFLFHPGFSTKEQVSEVSGRGVGMDVVKTNIEQLGGEVSLTTTKGAGSICRIFLPLTLAIIDGIVVKLGKEKYIFPLGQINEFLRPNKAMVSYVTGIGDCLTLRGSVLPIFDLSKELNRGSTCQVSYSESICMISQVKGVPLAIKVDDIVNQQQIVVKSLGPDIRNQKGFMGGSILGDGQPAFILDVVELFEGKLSSMPRANSKREVSA